MSRPKVEMQKVDHSVYYKLGLVADPAPEILLDKERLARLKVTILDTEVKELQNQMKIAEMYRDLLREQYKIR